MKTNPPQTVSKEPEHVIEFLSRVSEILKHQRRHFDDAVVIHCIRLIQDYAADDLKGQLPEKVRGRP